MKYILTITFTVILFSINAQEPKALFYIELNTILINKSDSIFYIKSNKPSFVIDSSHTIFYGADTQIWTLPNPNN